MQPRDHVDRAMIQRAHFAQAGEPRESGGHPAIEAIHQSAAYAFTDSEQADAWFASGLPLYARDRLPNVRTLERAVANLEAAEAAIAVASGMAAIATTVLALMRTGERVLIGHDAYCESTALLFMLADRFGITVDRVDLNAPIAVEAAITEETRLVLAETISNPGMRLLDIPMLSTITKRHGVLLAVDNTFATPVFCQPLAFGADLVIHSAGKFLAGHSDVTAGVVTGSEFLIAQLKEAAHLFGPVLAPMEAWLTTRGIRTLLPRLTWASASARQIAEWLAGQPTVERVGYAGLPSCDQAALVQKLLPRGAGPVLTFRIRGGDNSATAVVRQLQRIPYVPSVGGVSTIISFPPRAPYANPSTNGSESSYRCATLRLSVGLEHPDDIMDDLGQAFALVSAESVAHVARNGR